MIILGFFSSYFFYFSIKTYVVGSLWKHITKELIMTTHNIHFMEYCKKYSQNYSQILLLNNSSEGIVILIHGTVWNLCVKFYAYIS